MNYTALVQAISDYTENQFNTVDMNTFIVQAEQRVFNTVQFPALRSNVLGAATAGNPYLALPANFLATYSVAVIDASGNYTMLVNKDVAFIREAYPTVNATGLPKYYALFGAQTATPDALAYIMGPTPDQSYSVELHYFYYPTSITLSSDGTSWLGNNFDTVLLYGALVEAYTFMKGEDDLLKIYDAKYKEALQMAKRLGDGLERGDAYRDAQTKIKVT